MIHKRRDEEEIKKFIQESDYVSLGRIKEALSLEENRREMRLMKERMESEKRERTREEEKMTQAEAWEAVIMSEIIEEMRNG